MRCHKLDEAESDNRARNRFFIIYIVRFAGIALLLLGLFIFQGRGFIPQPYPLIGGIVISIGLITALMIPQILVRLWRSPS